MCHFSPLKGIKSDARTFHSDAFPPNCRLYKRRGISVFQLCWKEPSGQTTNLVAKSGMTRANFSTHVKTICHVFCQNDVNGNEATMYAVMYDMDKGLMVYGLVGNRSDRTE
jgi:hypothetical protein